MQETFAIYLAFARYLIYNLNKYNINVVSIANTLNKPS